MFLQSTIASDMSLYLKASRGSQPARPSAARMICRSVNIFLIFMKAFLKGEESSSNRKRQQLLFYARLKTLPPLIDFKTTFHTLFQLVDFFLYPPRPFRLFILLYKFLVRDHLKRRLQLRSSRDGRRSPCRSKSPYY